MAEVTRRAFLETGTAALATAAVAGSAPLQALAARPLSRGGSHGKAKGKLQPAAFAFLPLGAVRPAGWLERQLRVQADGMGGHLDEFWPDVGLNSGWLGGTGESWERGPYFVDGLLPLAWQLNDDALKAKALRFVNWTLEHQQPSGMIGPPTNDDWWPRMVMCKVLQQYQEATGDPRVVPVLTRYFHYQLTAMPARPLREWGKYRWQDEAMVVEWLYERTGDPKLLQLAHLLQQQGFDWVGSFANFKYTDVTTRAFLESNGENKPEGMQTHGVNNGQAIKTAAVQYRLSGNTAEHANYNRQVAALDRYHGVPNGMFSCDEHLAGLDPSHGTELCTVVETMFSMEVALATFGDPLIGDRIEKIAFNALPGTFTDDMWAHQYDQQSNQIVVGLNSKPWTTNGTESNLYGLEPNFGCCTANFHQGWPKLTSSLWMRSPDGGLVAALYAPCTVDTEVHGQRVHLRVETDYPFREAVRVTVLPDRGTAFPLRLRIPAWAKGATLRVTSQSTGEAAEVAATPGTFALVERHWMPGDVIELQLPMVPTATRWFHNSLALNRGPLVFSLDPGETWVKLRERAMTADWQVFPQGQWNYALRVDEATAPQLRVEESPVGARPFTAEGAGVRLHVPGKRLNAWRSADNVAGPVPEGLQTSSEPEEMLVLVPYGAAKLRVTAFPQLQG